MKHSLLLVPLLTLLAATASSADQGLVVTPHRVILTDKVREAKVTVTNTGDEKGTYRLYFANYRMTADGAFESVTSETEGLRFADKLVRYSPRQIELPPGMTQVARVQLRLPSGLAPGEYRSHLVFQTQPTVTPALTSEHGRTRAAVRTLYGLSIPVIVRRGKTWAKVQIADIERHGDTVTFSLMREGNESVYGDISVAAVAQQKETVVGESNGLAVYTPLEKRRVTIPLKQLPKGSSKLIVRYHDSSAETDLAAGEISLQ